MLSNMGRKYAFIVFRKIYISHHVVVRAISLTDAEKKAEKIANDSSCNCEERRISNSTLYRAAKFSKHCRGRRLDLSIYMICSVLTWLGCALAFFDLDAGQDYLSRLNFLILVIIVVALLLNFIRGPQLRILGVLIAALNVLLWMIAVYAGSPGGWQSLFDVFRF